MAGAMRAKRIACGLWPVLGLVLATGVASGRGSTPWEPSTGATAERTEAGVSGVLPPPALLARVDEARPAQPLAVARLDARATITAFLSKTSMTLTFRNDLDRVLEGELVFPLPEGATVSGYAIDVRGEMVDGVVVERHEARIAFEKEVRKGIDPGLVEWVQGNAYRTRVWPIPARGQRTVRIEYVTALETRGEGGALAALYRLPLAFREAIPEVSIRVEVVEGSSAPQVRGDSWGSLRFEKWEKRYVAEMSQRDLQPSGDLVVALPDVPRESAAVERSEDGGWYFVVNDFPAIPEGARPSARKGRVALLWDASLSRASADLSLEMKLIGRWLGLVRDVEVDVIAFRNVPGAARPLSIKNADARGLLAAIRSEPFDGGTSLSALKGALERSKRYSYAILFSDGFANLGGDPTTISSVPVYTVSSGSQANHAVLRAIAERSGGAYLNLQTTAIGEAAEAIGAEAFGFEGAAFDETEVADVYPAAPRPVRGRLTLSGRLLSKRATITLRYGGAGAAVQERRYTLEQAAAGSSGLVPRFWAEQRVAALSVQAESHREELLALGRRFGIVTPGASLLVLETVEQYLEHGIEPPASRKALREEYRRRLGERDAASKKAKGDKLDRVAAIWTERVRWWQTEYEVQPGFRYKEQKVAAADAARAVGGVVGGVAGGVETQELRAPALARPEAAGEPPVPPPPASPARLAQSARQPVSATEADAQAVPGGPVIAVTPWDPATPYLAAMRAAGVDGAYDAYLEQRKAHGTSPAFFLDCADFFLRAGRTELALRALTAILELGLEDARLFRVAAHRLQQAGELELAIELFEKVRRLRPEEPQSLRDLALALSARGDAQPRQGARLSDRASRDYLRAIELLYDIALGSWDARFPEIELTALMDLNRVAALLERDGRASERLAKIDPRLRKLLDLDVRVVLTWDTDLTDMDLWVVEPSGEKCFYSHALTTIGGMISKDFTGGYGPEEYLVRRALPGTYEVKANYFGSRAQSLVGPTTVQATVITHFGRDSERRKALTLRLNEAKEVVDVGAVRFEAADEVGRPSRRSAQ
jgi:Ca-activated chloride channel family protein